MKQIIFFILMSMVAFAQMTNEQKLLIIMADDKAYEPEVTAFQNALTTKLNYSTIDTLDLFVKMLKDSLGLARNSATLKNKLDRMWDLRSPTIESSLKDLIYLSNATNTNNYTYTAWKGYGGDTNTVRYINTNFVPSTNGIAFTLNSSSMGVYSSTNTSGTVVDLGARNGTGNKSTELRIRQAANAFLMSQSSNSTYSTDTSFTSVGFFMTSRTSSTIVTGYKNSISTGDITLNADGLTGYSLFLGGLNNANALTAVTTRRYAFVIIGGGLTATEVRGVRNCIVWYLTKEGAN